MSLQVAILHSSVQLNLHFHGPYIIFSTAERPGSSIVSSSLPFVIFLNASNASSAFRPQDDVSDVFPPSAPQSPVNRLLEAPQELTPLAGEGRDA
uniref:Uncharacterized protein n=1 Tax=Panagrellus redivivus TaxID=6233 RepID=A0A7E4UY69_PANRE